MTEPSYLTPTELEGVQKIREKLTKIPADLDTDFNLVRWWRGYHGNVEEIETKFMLYVENRRVLGYDSPNFLETFYQTAKVARVSQYFSTSRLLDTAISKDNGIVLVESGDFDKNLPRVVKTGEYLEVFFGCCEVQLQMVLRQEKKTGRPAHGVCIFDMKGVNLASHLNPLSPTTKVFKMRANIWQEFYPEMMQKILIVNPPTFFNLLWTCVRYLLNESAQKLITIVSKHRDLLQYLEPDVIPVAYGGTLKDPSSWGRLDNCCNPKIKVTEKDYAEVGQVWKDLGVCRPLIIEMDIRPKKTFVVAQLIEFPNTVIAWQFWANSDVEFGIIRSEGEGQPTTLVYPRLKLVTTKLQEEGTLLCKEPGPYYLEFNNPSQYFWLKMHYAVTAIHDNKMFEQRNNCKIEHAVN